MTDIIALTKELFEAVNQQRVPEQVDKLDLAKMILSAIKDLYVISGRSSQWSDDLIVYDADMPSTFENTLEQDEQRWVLLQAQIAFYKWVQASVDDQTSYTTDAMSVTHGDKPYEHIGATIDRLEGERDRIWYSMVRFNQLGVSG